MKVLVTILFLFLKGIGDLSLFKKELSESDFESRKMSGV